MNNRSLQTIVLLAALIILANCFQPVAAQAMSSQCCCSSDACKCCCSAQQTPQPSDMLFSTAAPAASDCSCSSGPNPYGRDAATSSTSIELKKKRHIQHNAPLSFNPGAFFCSTLARSDKPPPLTVKYLYLLHRSFLI